MAVVSLITTATLISTMSALMAGLRKLREDEFTEFRLLRHYLQLGSPVGLGFRV